MEAGVCVDNRYVIVKKLGEGAFGKVYLANEISDRETVRQVALKVFKSPHNGDAENEGVITDEYMAMLAALRSERYDERGHFIQVYGYGTIPNTGGYIAMEYLDSAKWTTWGDCIRRQMSYDFFPSEDEIARIATQLFESLDVLHGARIVHGDINPGNLFIDDDGNIKIGDFGLSKAVMSRLSRTKGAAPTYSAPELFGGQICFASDIYAAGLCLYKLWTHTQPFEQALFEDDGMARQRGLRYEWIYVTGGDVSDLVAASPRLDAVLSKCLKPGLHERFQTAGDVISALSDPSGWWTSGQEEQTAENDLPDTVDETQANEYGESGALGRLRELWARGDDCRLRMEWEGAIYAYTEAAYINTVHRVLSYPESTKLLGLVMTCFEETGRGEYADLYKRKCIRLLQEA